MSIAEQNSYGLEFIRFCKEVWGDRYTRVLDREMRENIYKFYELCVAHGYGCGKRFAETLPKDLRAEGAAA